ncbi:MAG: hypothetical protein H0U57_14485 [Tatlockia sp.]|nr:hypothetical protein [Tatlockia sp.]
MVSHKILKKKIKVYLNSIILGFYVLPANSTALLCPPQINTKQFLEEKVPGWNEFLEADSKLSRLNRINFYAGHPKANASLAPDNENISSGKLTWTFNESDLWIGCAYSNTAIQLTQKLPHSIKKCTVSYDLNSSMPTIVAINCQ